MTINDRERVAFIFSAATVAIAGLIERGEIVGNVMVPEGSKADAEAHFSRCMAAGMPSVTSAELRQALLYIISKGGVIEMTARGEAAAAFDKLTEGVGAG